MESAPLALVTGGAHRLGKSFAMALGRAGYAVCVHYLTSATGAQRTLQELHALGVPAFLVRADLRDPLEIQAMFGVIDSIPHRMRVLVNSAGTLSGERVETLTVEQWDTELDVNLRAPFLCAQQAAERMQQGGLIVNVTDVGARMSWSRFPAYAVSKAGLEALTRVLARAYAPKIRANAIAPGLVLRSSETSEAAWHQLLKRLPLRRAATVDEVAAALEFLLANEYVTGQTLAVDGGYSLLG